ncbi:MAG: cobalt-precorrin 5A hydrolase [Treponema sp.]|nr:cobalt-precorrin 5A hydrolase [Treponema sp.]
MQVHIISFTQAGFSLSERIQNLLSQADFSGRDGEVTLSFAGNVAVKNENFLSGENLSLKCPPSSVYMPLSQWVQTHFRTKNALVFVGAAGIAVRAIAPFVKDKKNDPAVIVIDEKGSFVIPLLSGHIGGANELARKIASQIGAMAVITTASDVNNLPAIDEFASKNNLSINDMKLAKDFAARLLAKNSPEFTISVYIKNDILSLIPKCLVLGIGCKKGKSREELKNFVFETLKSYKIDIRSLVQISSVDQKKDEKAIISLAEDLKLPFVTFSTEELNSVSQKVSHSDFVEKTLGTDNVCERAVFASGADELLLPKTARNGMTLAVGMRKIHIEIPENLKVFHK